MRDRPEYDAAVRLKAEKGDDNEAEFAGRP